MLIARNRGAVVALAGERIPQVDVRFGRPGQEPERLAHQPQCLVERPLIGKGHPEVHQCNR